MKIKHDNITATSLFNKNAIDAISWTHLSKGMIKNLKLLPPKVHLHYLTYIALKSGIAIS